MQGIEQIAYQNACIVAQNDADTNGVAVYVYRNAAGLLATTTDYGVAHETDGGIIHTAEPGAFEPKEG